MSFIVRRKDPPAWEGALQKPWQTVARRGTLKEAQQAMVTLRKLSNSKTGWWCGEESQFDEQYQGDSQ